MYMCIQTKVTWRYSQPLETSMLNQSSAMLVSAVLVDTFVVRSLVVLRGNDMI